MPDNRKPPSQGKGDKMRPMDKNRFDDNYNQINWGKVKGKRGHTVVLDDFTIIDEGGVCYDGAGLSEVKIKSEELELPNL